MQHPHHRARRLTRLARSWPLLLALGLVLAACGDDPVPEVADGPAATNTRTPVAAATATSTAEPIPGAAEFPRTIEDSSGTALTMESAPQRIISYSPGATEILFAIGAGEQVVGVDEFSDFPPQVEALEKLNYSEPDPERALALSPDLLILSTQQGGQVEQFRGLDLPVFFNAEPSSVEETIEDVIQLGALTGRDGEAAELADSMRARVEAVLSRIGDAESGPTVFFELDSSLYTVSAETFVGDLLALLGARNIAADAESPFPQLSAEAVIEADPDVLLLADAKWGETPEIVCARPGWDVISACRNERVHPVDPDLTNRPGPRVVDGLEAVARALYPERFE